LKYCTGALAFKSIDFSTKYQDDSNSFPKGKIQFINCQISFLASFDNLNKLRKSKYFYLMSYY